LTFAEVFLFGLIFGFSKLKWLKIPKDFITNN
jgi:hypothetical protein